MQHAFKQLLASCVLGLSSFAGFAGSMGEGPIEMSPYQGFYVGVLAGVNALSGTASQPLTLQLIDTGILIDNFTLYPNPTANVQTGLGGLLAGYDFLMSPHTLLGLEVRANFFNARILNQSSLAGISANLPISIYTASAAEVKQDFDFILKPGLLLNDESSCLYLIGGAFVNKLKNINTLNFYRVSDSEIGAITFVSANAFGSDQWRWGSVFGLGLQQDLCYHLTLRLEYNHLVYQSAKSTSGLSPMGIQPEVENLIGTIPSHSEAKLRGDRVTLGLTYHF